MPRSFAPTCPRNSTNAFALRWKRLRRRRPVREHKQRSPLFWWASSLTGLAAALGLVALLNLRPDAADPVQIAAPPTVAGSAAEPIAMPALRTRTAVLTAPLEEELDELEADLEKARALVREDLGLEF